MTASARDTLAVELGAAEPAPFTLLIGDVTERLQELDRDSVHCVVTSPPYWALRDYGTAKWEGGDPACEHRASELRRGVNLADSPASTRGGGKKAAEVDVCRDCGAKRVDQQLGLEDVPDCQGWATGDRCGCCFVCHMVDVFREVRRVLRPDGTVWLNIGDSYASKTRGSAAGWDKSRLTNPGAVQKAQAASLRSTGERHRGKSVGLKPKDLVGIPWRLAFALQADGWYLRADIIWAKGASFVPGWAGSVMPESVRDRPTKSHEYLFLLTKQPRYYFDGDAIREPAKWERWGDQHTKKAYRGGWMDGDKAELQAKAEGGRNVRTVWGINPQPFSEWGETVRRVRVEVDAPGDGKTRTTSPDCPVHGDRPVPAPTAGDGEHAVDSSTRSEHTGGRRASGLPDEPAPIEQNRELDSPRGSSDSPARDDAQTASAHSTESHKRASRSTSGGRACAGTHGHIEGTSPSHGSPALDGFGSRVHVSIISITEKTSHFATFPPALVEPCVKAGTSERGCCPECGAPWGRVTSTEYDARGRTTNGPRSLAQRHETAGFAQRLEKRVETVGWVNGCDCTGAAVAHPPIPCIVLDPFMGSGTVALVARRLGRASIGIELNPGYARLAEKRLEHWWRRPPTAKPTADDDPQLTLEVDT